MGTKEQYIEYLRITFTNGKYMIYEDGVNELLYTYGGIRAITQGKDRDGIFDINEYYPYHTIESMQYHSRDIEDK